MAAKNPIRLTNPVMVPPVAGLNPVKGAPDAELQGSKVNPFPTSTGAVPSNVPVVTPEEQAARGHDEYVNQQQNAKDQGYAGAYTPGWYSSAPTDSTKQAILMPDGSVTYENAGAERPIQQGTSGADEMKLSEEDYNLVQAYKTQWAEANARGDVLAAQLAHEAAEAIRAKYGYSGDTDTRTDGGGFRQISTGAANRPASAAGAQVNAGGDDLTSLLEEWKKAAAEQANGQIDYAVAQAITQLERALEDSKAQYKEQAESVARDERQAMDNSALYAELRGDKGGIGQAQYNEIQAAAAQNRLAVQQAQTKLATDTARQIADLRAQGEFEKADKALEITQTYLSQLINLEQWAAEFGLSQAQFEASLQQWRAEFDLAMKEFNYNVATNERGYTASMAEALMAAGVPLDDEQLKAIGWSRDQYNDYLRKRELEAAAGGDETAGPGDSKVPADVYAWLAENGAVDYGTAYQLLRDEGYGTTDAKTYAEYFNENKGRYITDEFGLTGERSAEFQKLKSMIDSGRYTADQIAGEIWLRTSWDKYGGEPLLPGEEDALIEYADKVFGGK